MNTTHTVHKHTRSCCMYTHYWCISTGEGKKKRLEHGKALKDPWLQSHSCSQRAKEAAGDRYTGRKKKKKSVNHTHSHRQTHTQILLVTKCPICSKKWQSLRALKAPLFSCLKGAFLSWQTLVWSSVWFVTFLIDRRDIGGMSTPANSNLLLPFYGCLFFSFFFSPPNTASAQILRSLTKVDPGSR